MARPRGWRHRLPAGVLPGVLIVAAATGAIGADSVDNTAGGVAHGPYRFRADVEPAPAVAASLLSAQERAFIAALPPIRVAVPLPPARPYERIDGLAVTGIHPDMLVGLARAFGLQLRPVVLPSWSAALDALKRREVDLLMTLSVSPERLQFLDFTLGATPLPGALFTRPGDDTRQLERARFVLERDYVANHFVRRQYPQASVLTVETTGDALAAVADRRADVYLGSLLEASEWIARERIQGVAANRLQAYGTGYYHFAVRKDWAPLAAILNRGIPLARDASAVALRAAIGDLPGTPLPPPLPLSAAQQALLAQRAVWRVGAVRDQTLLNDIDAAGRHSGIAAEYTEHIARRLGVGVHVLPFDNVREMTQALAAGTIDVIPFLARTPERDAEFAFSAPYVDMPYLLVARRDAPLYWGLESLNGKRLALFADHPLRVSVSQRAPDARVIETLNAADAMDLVANGQADAAIEIKLLANYHVNEEPRGRLRVVGPVDVAPSAFHFAVRRDNAPLADLIDRALADIAPQERTRLYERWVAVDLAPTFRWQRYGLEIGIAASALLLLALATAWWMRRLRNEVTQRRHSEELLTDIATTVPGVAFRHTLDQAGQVRRTFYTPGARAFLGVEIDPSRRVIDNLAPGLQAEDLAHANEAAAHALASGEPFKVTLPYAHPDGRLRWLLVEAVRTAVREDGTVWTGYVVDVTPERELQAQLQREAAQRNVMLASASHELRAPTHTLQLALQAVRAEHLSADDRNALAIASDATATLKQLLADVLDAARIDSEGIRLRPQTVPLRALLNDIAKAWSAAARSKGLRFDTDISRALPLLAVIDPLRLRQVLTNLLSNACKYTHQGSVTLRVTTDASATLCVQVSDTGIGIAAADQAALFRPFQTVGHADAVPEGRSGLGLSICAHLVQLMQGTIRLDSAPQAGTTVTVTLPLVLPPAASVAAPVRGGPILVCDDDDVSRLLLTQILQRIGYAVTGAPDGAQALDAWRREDVSAVITDVDMPGMNGIELVAAIRREEAAQNRHTLLIICSGSDAPALDNGGTPPPYDAYIVKPVTFEQLSAVLKGLGLST